MTPSRSPHNGLHTAGFTLAELVITIAIVSMVGVIIGKFQGDIFSFNRLFYSSFSSADQAQKLLRPMTAELRSASQSSNGSYPIESFAANDITFYSDIDNNSKKDKVRYYVSGTTMYKQVTAPTGNPSVYNPANTVSTTFMTGVRNVSAGLATFRYFSSAHTGGDTGEVVPGSGNIEDVRLVKITIRTDADPAQPPAPTDVTTQVSIRNLKQQ